MVYGYRLILRIVNSDSDKLFEVVVDNNLFVLYWREINSLNSLTINIF